MTDTKDSKIDIDALMHRIRQEVESRRAGRQPGAVAPHAALISLSRDAGASGPDRIALPRLGEYGGSIEMKRAYSLRELIAFHDLEFVDAAFLAALGRPADPNGAVYYLDKLRTGSMSKVEILGRLRFSREGRQNGTRIRGLFFPFVLQHARRIPVIGALGGLVLAILRLPEHLRGFQRLETHVFRRQRETEARFDQLADTAETALRNTASELAATIRDRSADHRTLDALNTGFKSVGESVVALEALATRLAGVVPRLEHAETLAEDWSAMRPALLQTAMEVGTLATQLSALAARTESIETAKADGSALDRLRREWSDTQSADRAALDATAASVAGTDEAVKAVWSRVAEIEGGKVDRPEFDRLAQRIEAELADRTAALAVDTLRTDLAANAREVAAHRRNIVDLDRRLSASMDALLRRPRGVVGAVARGALVHEDAHRLDAFYAAFEDRFRGSREEIKARAQFYLPVIAQATAGFPDAPILDIGCGRGEWLELLEESGFVARGVDLNRVTIEQCRALGLAVEEVDALDHLRGLGSNSLGAITAMHVVEHLEFEKLIALFDECLRVVRPGGVIAFETPNPENVRTGACNFYYDPTHKNPIPPPLLQFIAEARGFADPQIYRLSENRGAAPPSHVDPSAPGASEINLLLDLIRPAPDYALVARKT